MSNRWSGQPAKQIRRQAEWGGYVDLVVVEGGEVKVECRQMLERGDNILYTRVLESKWIEKYLTRSNGFFLSPPSSSNTSTSQPPLFPRFTQPTRSSNHSKYSIWSPSSIDLLRTSNCHSLNPYRCVGEIHNRFLG